MYAEVLRENAFLSRTIEVQENQTVIDTGLYANYFYQCRLYWDLFIFFFIFLAYPQIIAKRIKGEEAFLEKELPGYAEYRQKV